MFTHFSFSLLSISTFWARPYLMHCAVPPYPSGRVEGLLFSTFFYNSPRVVLRIYYILSYSTMPSGRVEDLLFSVLLYYRPGVVLRKVQGILLCLLPSILFFYFYFISISLQYNNSFYDAIFSERYDQSFLVQVYSSKVYFSKVYFLKVYFWTKVFFEQIILYVSNSKLHFSGIVIGISLISGANFRLGTRPKSKALQVNLIPHCSFFFLTSLLVHLAGHPQCRKDCNYQNFTKRKHQKQIYYCD